jgi:hypothetical protein
VTVERGVQNRKQGGSIAAPLIAEYRQPELSLKVHCHNNGYHGSRRRGKQKVGGLSQSIIRKRLLRGGLTRPSTSPAKKNGEQRSLSNAARRRAAVLIVVCNRL